jgi:hypothetical protein
MERCQQCGWPSEVLMHEGGKDYCGPCFRRRYPIQEGEEFPDIWDAILYAFLFLICLALILLLGDS